MVVTTRENEEEKKERDLVYRDTQGGEGVSWVQLSSTASPGAPVGPIGPSLVLY